MNPIRRPDGLRCAMVLIASALCILSTLVRSSPDDSLIVATAGGRLKGVSRPSGGAEFLGIPYAQPPVGALRWHEPVPFQAWTGVRDAAMFGAPCAQPVLGDWNKHDAETSREDCLFLNVITPVWPPPQAALPVMFWIHGGANAGGTASSSLYKDGTLVQHGVVLVSINYRLSVFGFLAHPELTRESPHRASGNYGLMDQLAALRWVRDNIARFGGDPANITVFGQSAGGYDIGLLMTSPLSKGLFHRAIVQSGSAVELSMRGLAEAEKSGETLAAALQAPAGKGALEYLRKLGASELLAGVARQRPLVGTNIDSWVIPRSPIQVFAAGRALPIPLMIGTTTREFRWSGSVDELRKLIQDATGSLADRALSLYGLAGGGTGNVDPQYGSAGDQWVADFTLRCPVSMQAAWHAAAKHPTYQYEFERAIPGQEAQGAVHSADLPYVFGFYPKSGNISGNFGATDYRLADLMETYWTNFAKKGNPNSGTLPHWPQSGSSQALIKFTQAGTVAATSGGLRRPQCDLLREVFTQQGQ